MNKGKLKPVIVSVMLLIAAAMLAAVWLLSEDSRPAESAAHAVYISEAMSDNTLCAPASDGSFYDWAELHVVSPTSFGMERQCMAKNAMADMSFHPDDISVSDNAAFIWQIV